MKKVIFIFLFILVILFSINVNGEEMVVPDLNSNNYSCVGYLGQRETFNYLELKFDDYVNERIEYYNLQLLNDCPSNSVNNIHFLVTLDTYSKDGDDIGDLYLHIKYEIKGKSITNISIDINNEILINATYSGIRFFFENNHIDFKEINENIELVQYKNYTSWYDYMILNDNKYKPDLFIVMTYDYAKSEDIYIPSFSDLTVSDIVNEVGLIDNFNDRIIDYDLISGNYNNNSYVGDYEIKIRGFNKEKQAVFKWIYIHVIDIDGIAKISNFKTTCINKIEDIDIIDELDISMDYESINISSEYHYCSNKKGKYKYIAYIKFPNMNLLIPGFIDVEDNEKPYGILAPTLITVSNDSCKTKDEILENFVIYDDHDGYISNLDITLDGIINYMSTYSSLNDHEITLIAKDSSNNIFEHKFILRVTDDKLYSELERFVIPEYISNNAIDEKPENDVIEEAKENYNPVISNSNYVIRAYTIHKLTASEVQDLLISDGYLNNDDVVSIDSEYFKEANPKAGTFSLSVTYQNGDITYYEINLVEKEEIKEEEKSYTGLIVSIIIGSIVFIAIVIIVIMRVYVHVKKN